MIVYCSSGDGDFAEVDISATKAEFVTFAGNLALGPFTLECDTKGIDPFPYQRLLEQISVEDSGEALEVSVVQRFILRFNGDRRSLHLLAENIRNFCESGKPGNHFHLEYIPEERFLAPDAIPLVFTMT